MFERYTERARRVLFFARYEASQLGSISIETEHLLLGLIREGKAKTASDIRELMSGNLCRCGAYPNILAAIERTIQAGAGEKAHE